MIKKYLTVALAALAFVACAPEYDTDKLPIVIEELPTSGEGKLLDPATGEETAHTYSYSVTENGVEIKATIAKGETGWAVGYFMLNSTMLQEELGDLADFTDTQYFHSNTASSWSSYAPGEWVDANGNSTSWDKGHVYWFYQHPNISEDPQVKDSFVIGHNAGNSVVGETITSSCTFNGKPFNVTITMAE